MKQKIYSLLLMALLGTLGMNVWAQSLSTTTIGGKEYYEIGSADDLVELADLVNSGDEMDANAVLTADIDMSGLESWTAIGDWRAITGGNACYKGHFDGQGHKIKNFSFNSNQNYYGIFGVISECLIENFSVFGEFSTNIATGSSVAGYARDNNTTIRNVHSYATINNKKEGTRIGGILGTSHNGTIFIDRCTFSGKLDGKDAGRSGNYGGIVGYLYNGTGAHLTITNCLFDGELVNTAATPGKCTFGGMVGYVGASPEVTLKNCLSIGTLQSAVTGQFYGAVKHNTCFIINSFYQGDNVNGSESTVTPTTQEVTKLTDAQLASGEIAFLLNESVSGGENWFQQLKNMVFAAEQYIVNTNGTPRDPQTANVTLVGEEDGTYTFLLPNFVLHTNTADLPVGDIRLEGITINDDGTFSDDNTISVPDENIPAILSSYSDKFKNLHYNLNGKVNGNRLYATIEDISINLGAPFPAYNISIEAGTDDFTAAAPLGDAYPKPYGTAKVYANGSFNCDMTPKEGSTIIYSNTESSIIDPHSFTDGFCTVCGAIDETYMAANADGYFEIANEKQLVWFAAYVNQKAPAANAILVDNIDMTGTTWTPIGKNVYYTGTFNGDGWEISNLTYEGSGDNNGLFGKVKGATIGGFAITGTLTCAGTGTGVIGWSEGATITDIDSGLTINAADGDGALHHAGGIVGSARTNGSVGTTIERCSYSGTMTVNAESHDCFGGIVGYTTDYCTITNCANYGTIQFKRQNCYAGGIIGYINSTTCNGAHNCLNIGSVIYLGEGDPTYSGAIVGRLRGNNSELWGNSYWLEGSAANANGENQIPTNYEVTAAQIASGEVAYKLGEEWTQELGADSYPFLSTYAPVYYVGEVGYATMYDTTKAWKLNGDAQAYIAAFDGTYLQLTAIEDIPVGTAVILKGTYYNNLAATATSDVSANELLGTDAETAADGTMYILAKPEGKEVGFYQAEGTIPAGKAYYKSTSSGVKPFFFSEDDATGIAGLKGVKDSKDLIYNVAGQRMQKMQRGINIVGGKKVLY